MEVALLIASSVKGISSVLVRLITLRALGALSVGPVVLRKPEVFVGRPIQARGRDALGWPAGKILPGWRRWGDCQQGRSSNHRSPDRYVPWKGEPRLNSFFPTTVRSTAGFHLRFHISIVDPRPIGEEIPPSWKCAPCTALLALVRRLFRATSTSWSVFSPHIPEPPFGRCFQWRGSYFLVPPAAPSDQS